MNFLNPTRVLVGVFCCLAWVPVSGQQVMLSLQPARTALTSCDDLQVDVRLETAGVGVAGYQIFLRFPAEHFEALRFEPGAIDASVFEAGPIPFGDGLEPCDGQVADSWDDGAADDVVAVAAAVFPSPGAASPPYGHALYSESSTEGSGSAS